MKELTKRTAVAALAGIMAAGMLAGCGEKKLDGTKTVATVNGTEIPMGIVSLSARQQQAQMEAMYMSILGGSSAGIWDTEAEEGKTYGEQAVEGTLEQIELMYIMKEKAADYNVEVTAEDEKAIAEAAAAFMEANSEETLEELAVTEDQVKTLLELETYRERIHTALIEEADVTVTDDEAQQSGFTYVSVSTSGEELTEEDIEAKKEQAQKILDQIKEDPAADMDEIAKGVDESYTALEGTFTTKASEDEDTSGSSYPDEVIEVLRGLKEGEVSEELIETDTSYYIVRLDKELDEEATESKRESLMQTKQNEYYTETTGQWLEDADVKTDDKVLKTLKVTDKHTFTMKTPEEDAAAEENVTGSDVTLDDVEEDAQEADVEEPEEGAAGETVEETGEDEAAAEETDAEVTPEASEPEE